MINLTLVELSEIERPEMQLIIDTITAMNEWLLSFPESFGEYLTKGEKKNVV